VQELPEKPELSQERTKETWTWIILLEILAVVAVAAGVVQVTTDFQLESLFLLISWVRSSNS
jgi:hypothetical protein